MMSLVLAKLLLVSCPVLAQEEKPHHQGPPDAVQIERRIRELQEELKRLMEARARIEGAHEGHGDRPEGPPPEMAEELRELIDQLEATDDPEEREALHREIEQLRMSFMEDRERPGGEPPQGPPGNDHARRQGPPREDGPRPQGRPHDGGPRPPGKRPEGDEPGFAPGPDGEGKHPQGPGRPDPEKIKAFLKENAPEMLAKLEELRESGRMDEYRQAMHDAMRKIHEAMQLKEKNPEAFEQMKEMRTLEHTLHELAERCRRAQGADREALIQQLREAAGKLFDQHLEARKRELAMLEKRIGEVRRELEEMASKKADEIEKRLRLFLEGPPPPQECPAPQRPAPPPSHHH